MTPWELFDNFGTIGLLIIAVIYFQKRLGTVNERLAQCELEREELRVSAAELGVKIGYLEKKIAI